jgi:Tfp pilus assembly protein PilZ
MSSDNREGDRQQIRFNIMVDDGSSFNAGVVNDVSDTGLFLETVLPLDAGTKVRLTTVDLGESEQITVEAEVVRVEPTDKLEDGQTAGMGLKFLNLSNEQLQQFFCLLDDLAEQAARESVDLDPYLSVMVPKRALSDAHLEVIRLSERDNAENENK